MATIARRLDPTIHGDSTQHFERELRARIVGQEEAVRAVVDLYQVFTAGMNSPGRPVGNLLFLGPTGSGKTHIVEAMAEILFGDPRAVIKVDCAEFQHSHEIAKLIGSPPGYLGHRETHPLITQEDLSKYHTDHLKLSFLLFDEIEKARDSLWQLLLGILDKATLTLGDNRRVDLSQTLIFMTSNLGSRNRRAACVTLNKNCPRGVSSTRRCTSPSSISSMSSSCSSRSGWNTTTLSRRFMNSGENLRRAASTAVRVTFTSSPSEGLSIGWIKPMPPFISSEISLLPRFDVMKISVCDRTKNPATRCGNCSWEYWTRLR